MTQLIDACRPYITDTWASYGIGFRKPDPRLWMHLGKVYGVAPDTIVHIGDRWPQDVHGPIRAGCHAIYVETREAAPDLHAWPDGSGRIAVAKNLQHAVADVVALNNHLA
jgi:FMN phosphatase YigB (HAD superfamily)